jgi:hypothetical protein
MPVNKDHGERSNSALILFCLALRRGAARLLILSQSGERPERYGDPTLPRRRGWRDLQQPLPLIEVKVSCRCPTLYIRRAYKER